MIKAVTIDNLNIKDHIRWAEDQTESNPIYLSEAQEVAQHPELLGNSIIYASQWELLLEWQKRNQPWASFEPPAKYYTTNRNLFSFRIFPQIYWEPQKESDVDHDEETPQSEPSSNLITLLISVKKPKKHPSALFEKEKTTLLNFLESIQLLNQLLAQISARKLQYQKG